MLWGGDEVRSVQPLCSCKRGPTELMSPSYHDRAQWDGTTTVTSADTESTSTLALNFQPPDHNEQSSTPSEPPRLWYFFLAALIAQTYQAPQLHLSDCQLFYLGSASLHQAGSMVVISICLWMKCWWLLWFIWLKIQGLAMVLLKTLPMTCSVLDIQYKLPIKITKQGQIWGDYLCPCVEFISSSWKSFPHLAP